MTKKPRKRKKLRVQQWIYILLLIASGVYVSIRGGAFSYALFYFLLLYPFLSIIYLLFCRAFVRVYQEIPVREMKKFKEESYQLVLENTGFLPVIGLTLFSEHTVYRDDMTGREMAFWPKEKKEFETYISCCYAGSYEIGITKLVFNDCFNILRLPLVLRTPLRVQVLPSYTKSCAEDIDQALQQMNRGSFSGGKTETESILGNDMAPYRPGDPLKRIHWKNYARSGELFVRLPEPKPVRMVTVALLARQRGSEEEDLKIRDEFIEYSVSVAKAFTASKRPVQFLYYNASVKRIPVEDYAGLNNLSFELSKELVLRGQAEEADARLMDAATMLGCPAFLIEEEVCSLCPM